MRFKRLVTIPWLAAGFLVATLANAQSLDATTPTSTGVVMPERKVVLAAKIVGRVKTVNVEEGDAVEAGALLIDIEDAELAAEVAATSARLRREEINREHVKKLAERVRKLHDQNAASAENLDEANFRFAAADEMVASARAALAKAEAQLEETKIKAPFSGIVIEKRVEPGDVTSPGEFLIKLEDQSTLKFRTSVQERYVPLLSKGQDAVVIIDALDDLQLDGTIARIIPSGDPSTHEFEVEITLPPQEKLYPGMFGKATFAP